MFNLNRTNSILCYYSLWLCNVWNSFTIYMFLFTLPNKNMRVKFTVWCSVKYVVFANWKCFPWWETLFFTKTFFIHKNSFIIAFLNTFFASLRKVKALSLFFKYINLERVFRKNLFIYKRLFINNIILWFSFFMFFSVKFF